jgi:predicted permease
MPRPPEKPATPGEAVYASLLRLYPKDFRSERGAEMLALYRSLARDARAGGPARRLAFAACIVLDLARSLPAEHARAFRERRRPRAPWASSGTLFRLSSFMEDGRFALRSFRRAPLFTGAVLATLALGVGATAAIFSVVDGVLLRPLPYAGEGLLVQIGRRYGEIVVSSAAPADYLELAARSRTLESVAAARLQTMDLAGSGDPERLETAAVTHSFFEVLGSRAGTGRGFLPSDDQPGGEASAVLSHAFWARRFGRDPSVLGRVLVLDGEPHTVVGVMPAGFRGPEALDQAGVAVWTAIGRIREPMDAREDAFLQLIARMRSGVEVPAAREELARIAERMGAQNPEAAAPAFWVEDLRARTVGDVGRMLWVLFGSAALLLVIACANVAHLFLVRAADRTREMAVRAALGAGRARLAEQLLTESILLAVVGGGLGALVARGGVAAFRSLAPPELPRLAEVEVDGRVLVFAVGVAVVTGIAFGLAPALEAARAGVADRLRAAGTYPTSASARHGLRGAFVALQTAFALVLLTSAALLLTAFVRLGRADPGFDVDRVAWIEMDLPPERYPDGAARAAFFQSALASIRARPGVASAAVIQGLPLDPGGSIISVVPEGHVPSDPDRPPRLPYHVVTPGYFPTLGIALVEGRDFSAADAAGATQVAIVTEAFAGRFWPDEPATGKRVVRGESTQLTVVGVAKDHHHRGPATPPEAMLYFPLGQVPVTSAAMVLRHDGEPGPLIHSIREVIWSVDPALPLDAFGTLGDVRTASLVPQRFRAMLLTSFAVAALGLTFIGLYGTLAHLVRARRREMGIRLALGAARAQVRGQVIAQGMRIAVAGLGLGLIGALAGTRVLASFLYGMTPTDPATLAGSIAFLGAVALLACWIPARRAAALDPAATLRAD